MPDFITRQEFLDRYDRQGTREIIKVSLLEWDRFLAARSLVESDLFAELRKPENKQKRYVLLDQLVQYLKRGRQPRTVRMYFQYVKAWMRQNEMEIEDWRIKTEIRFPKRLSERVRGVDAKMIRSLIDNCRIPAYKALWYIQAYGGMRIKSETLNMQWGWIDFAKSPLMITIPGKYTKTRQERITFLALEAEAWLREERERRKDEPQDAFVLMIQKKNGKWKKISYSMAYQYFKKRRISLGYNSKGENGRYHYHPHAYRGYAKAMISRGTTPEFSGAICGHQESVGNYFGMGTTDEQAQKDYAKALPYLAVSDGDKNQKDAPAPKSAANQQL